MFIYVTYAMEGMLDVDVDVRVTTRILSSALGFS